MKYTVSIEGMGCQMCVKKVTNALASIGAKDAAVTIGEAVFTFEGDEAAMKTAIENAGFGVVSVKAE